MATQTRDPVRTKRALLDGAARAVIKHGVGASLDAIARESGVSKGGLLHHYPTRDELLVALAVDLAEGFWNAVQAQIDPADLQPGRLLRAYVRTNFAEFTDRAQAVEHTTLLAALAGIPGIREQAAADGARWHAALAADGLDPQRVTLVTRATDGAAIASLYEGDVDPEEAARTEALLIALTRQTGPLVDPG